MDINKNDILKALKLSAQIILENGGETYRAEETISYICNSFGISSAESIATPTGIFISISVEGNEYSTIVKRINRRTINLNKINEVNKVSRQLTNHEIELAQAIKSLEQIESSDAIVGKFSFLYGGVSAAFFALLFGGGLFEFIVSLVSGTIVTLVNRNFDNIHSYQLFSSIVGGFIIAILAVLSTTILNHLDYNVVIVGSMMPLLPGLAMTNAIRDTIRGDLLSGMARGIEALLVAASLVAGTGVVISLAFAFGFIAV